jgi:DNA-binding transcriptional ArsR family regulator
LGQAGQPTAADIIGAAASFLGAFSDANRLKVLLQLRQGDKTVDQLEHLVPLSKPFISCQLADLCREGLVTARREGRVLVYTLADTQVRRLTGLLHAMF